MIEVLPYTKDHAQGVVSVILPIQQLEFGVPITLLAAHRFYEKNQFTEVPRAELPAAFPVMAVDSKFYRRRCPLQP